MKPLILLALASVAYAGSITTGGQDNGTTVNAIDVTGFATSGNLMGGMLVTGVFSTGSNAVCTWVNGGGNQGGCTAAGGGANSFSLALDGQTYSVNFALSAITGGNLLSLFFDGLPGFTVFDRSFSGNVGTDGSDLGRDASGSTSDGDRTINGVATYQNRVATLGHGPEGDLFAQVSLQFSGLGLQPGDTASFRMDTDNIGLRNGTPGSGVPEPSTFGLLGAALAGLALFRRARA